MSEKELQIFSDRLKEFRTSRKISQKDFAEKIGITASALSQYEKNTLLSALQSGSPKCSMCPLIGYAAYHLNKA